MCFTVPCEETMDMILDSWHRFLRHGRAPGRSLGEFYGLWGIPSGKLT